MSKPAAQTPANILQRIESKKQHKLCVMKTRDDEEYYIRNRDIYLARIKAAQDSLEVLEAQRNNAPALIEMLDRDIAKLQSLLKVSDSQAKLNKMAEMQKQIAALTKALAQK